MDREPSTHGRPAWFGWGGWFLSLALVGLIALSLVVPINIGLDGAGAQTDENEPPAATATAAAQPDPIAVVERVSPAVVTVINRQVVGDESADPQDAGAGTGFIIDDDGHIVTNCHVVAGGDAVRGHLRRRRGPARPSWSGPTRSATWPSWTSRATSRRRCRSATRTPSRSGQTGAGDRLAPRGVHQHRHPGHRQRPRPLGDDRRRGDGQSTPT